jgi:antitoxin VapB
MSVVIRDAATDRAIRELADLKGASIGDAVREAVEHELARERARRPLAERLAPLQDRFAAMSRPGGMPADKAFFDALSGED